MSNAFILDIETRPDPAIEDSNAWWMRFEDRLGRPGNIKDDLKIEEWRHEKILAERNRMALNGRTGCIAMVGVADLDDDDELKIFESGLDTACRASEGKVLLQLSSWLADLPSAGATVIGWNARKFDVPFLLARCALHGIALPRWFPNPRTYRRWLVDLYDDVFAGGTLSEWQFVFGSGFKDVEGEELLKIPLDELAHHLRDDLIETRELARRTEWAWRD